MKRKVGPKRKPGTRVGLTQVQAERQLQRMIADTRASSPAERMTLKEAADAYVRHVEHVMERKPSTVQDYRIMIDRHFEPHFGSRGIDKLRPDDGAGYLHAKARAGLASKTIANHLTFLHGVFAHAMKRGWTNTNPVAAVDRPRGTVSDPDIRFLENGRGRAVRHAPCR